MGVIRTIGTVSSVNSAIIPVYTGTVISAVSFSITNNIATIVLGAGLLPTNGYNGPNGFPTSNTTTGAKFDTRGGISGQNSGGAAGGQQVTLWGFATATVFNGKTVTILDNDGSSSFRFYIQTGNVASTADAGKTAAIPVDRPRKVRIEAAQTLPATELVFVGDLNVSSTRYYAALTSFAKTTPPFQCAIEITGDNIPADRIFISGSNGAGTDSVVVSLIY